MNEEERKMLVKIAKEAIKNRKKTTSDDIPDKLKGKKGVFVSVYVDGKLRGCIGYLNAIKPIYEAVIDNSLAAAYEDDRFQHIREKELDKIEVEISILSEPLKLEHKDAKDLIEKLKGHDMGVIVKKGYYQATFLPQVWKKLSDTEMFLNHLCLKAGLRQDAWKYGIDVYIYIAEVWKG